MGILRRINAAILLLILCVTLLALPTAATTTTSTHNGLEVTVEMDKAVYDAGEPITATITVRNTTSDAVTISNLEQLIPVGYKLSADSKAAVTNVELRPNGVAVLKVTFEGEPEAVEAARQGDIWGKLLYGETMGIPNLLITVILLIAFAIFMFLT